MVASKFIYVIITFFLSISLVNSVSTVNQSQILHYEICAKDSFRDNNCSYQSLDEIEAIVTNQTNVHIDIKVSQLHLNNTIKFENIDSLIINGVSNRNTSILCTDFGAGIILKDIVGKVELKKITMKNCGSKILLKSTTFLSALTILNCGNLEVTHLVIEKSNGVGLIIENYLGSRVYFQSTSLNANKLQPDKNGKNDSNSVLGGGGALIAIQPGANNQQDVATTEIIFNDCTFEGNLANNTYYEYESKSDTNDSEHFFAGYGRGGGVYILLEKNLSNVIVSFFRSIFTRNQAYIGGGLSVRISAVNRNITIMIEDSVFKQNGCHDIDKKREKEKVIVKGGGAHLTFDAYLDDSDVTMSHYVIKRVRFEQNSATLGGGLYHYSGIQEHDNKYDLNSMLLEECTFEGNKAHIGAAIIMAPSNDRRILHGDSIQVKLNNTSFHGNIVHPLSQISSVEIAGWGTFYVSSYDIQFLGCNIFENNHGSAVYIVNGALDLKESDMIFCNNSGQQGGAIALTGTSYIIFGPKSYQFINNTAVHQGGALYVSVIDKVNFINQRNCFVQCVDAEGKILYENCTADIKFRGNRVENNINGNSIFATSLRPCVAYTIHMNDHKKRHVIINSSEVFTLRGMKFEDDEDRNQSQISTDAAMLVIENSCIPLQVLPGERTKHDVSANNDFGNDINASFWAFFQPEGNDVQLDSAYSTMITDTIKVKGVPKERATMSLNVQSPVAIYSKMQLEILECPPGFKLKDKVCVCNAEAHKGLIKCDQDKFQSHIMPGFWMGFIEQNHSLDGSSLVTSLCPFCNSSLTSSTASIVDYCIVLPRNISKLSETVCGETREGIVCGRCREGYTVHFHSPGYLCQPAEPVGCKLGWLFYILSELIPVTVVFITVLVLNISFTSGAVNGFILFSQLLRSLDLSAGGTILISNDLTNCFEASKQIRHAIYGCFNLEFFHLESLSFCLWKGASALDMVAVKYITLVYAIVLIVSVIWIMNRCGGRWLGKYCRITTIKTSVIHGITSFLMIGYAQCVNTSLGLLLHVYIFATEDSDVDSHKRVWLNGEMKYFGTEHMPYALLAVFFLATIGCLPPLLLITYPLLNKILSILGIEEKKYVKLVTNIIFNHHLKPLLDSIQGCFKDNFRFFAGLYFLYRWVIMLIHITTVGYLQYYTGVGVFLVVVLTLHTVCQPYTKRLHNIIDALLLCNLVLINALSLSIFHRSNSLNPKLSNREMHYSVVYQLILICLPAFVLLMYIAIVIGKQLTIKCHNLKLVELVFRTKSGKMLRDCFQRLIRCPWNNSIQELSVHGLVEHDADSEFMSMCDYLEQRDINAASR